MSVNPKPGQSSPEERRSSIMFCAKNNTYESTMSDNKNESHEKNRANSGRPTWLRVPGARCACIGYSEGSRQRSQ